MCYYVIVGINDIVLHCKCEPRLIVIIIVTFVVVTFISLSFVVTVIVAFTVGNCHFQYGHNCSHCFHLQW